jgi:hypothetical protein
MDDVIEVAKSGRATCRTCRKKIDKGVLRFGEAAANQFDPDGGMTMRWHHIECAAGSLGAKVKAVLDAHSGEIPNRAEIEKLITSKKASAERAFPYAERAPTGRSRCIECNETIEKESWRVAIEREIDTGTITRAGAGYLHPACTEAHAGDVWDAVRENSGLSDAEFQELRGEAG